ncbi:MAG: ABC transporter permease [Bacillota bacterium]|nr:ABC transporter permease [Bacillota bacterium]
MRSFIIRRLLQILPVILAVVTINFVLIHLAPGDPAFILAGPEAPQEYLQEIRERLGLNKPLWEQYAIYMARAVKGDLGTSYRFKQPVATVIAGQVPATVLLTGTAFVVSVILGVGLGIISVQVKGGAFDRVSNALAVTLYSVPTFWIGLMLLLVFGVRLRWLPVQGMRSVAAGYTGWEATKDVARHLLLPAFTLTVVQIAEYMRLSRASMIEAMDKLYIRTARSKGLSERVVFYKHALRNALIPTVTVIGLRMGFLFTGAVLIETVFGWPGVGRLMNNAVFSRDYPLLLGILLVTAVMVCLANFTVDLSYAFIDPRIKYK